MESGSRKRQGSSATKRRGRAVASATKRRGESSRHLKARDESGWFEAPERMAMGHPRDSRGLTNKSLIEPS